jgi:hypothetical protein
LKKLERKGIGKEVFIKPVNTCKGFSTPGIFHTKVLSRLSLLFISFPLRLRAFA